jgi:hypothetical protein
MSFPKLRISIKWLLVGFAVFAIVLFVLFVYPAYRAEQLVGAINRGDVHPYEAVERPQAPQLARLTTDEETAVAQLLPRSWRDVWHFQRRIGITMTWSLNDPKYVLQHEAIILSRPTGFHLFVWNERQVRKPTKTEK